MRTWIKTEKMLISCTFSIDYFTELFEKCNFTARFYIEKCNLKAMLYRKIGKYIEQHLLGGSDKILLIEGARVFLDEIQQYPQFLTCRYPI